MKTIFYELCMFLQQHEDAYYFDGDFDSESLAAVVLEFAEELERRIH